MAQSISNVVTNPGLVSAGAPNPGVLANSMSAASKMPPPVSAPAPKTSTNPVLSSNPFLNGSQPSTPSTGGTTTASTAPNSGGNVAGIAAGKAISTPIPAGGDFSGLIPTPNLQLNNGVQPAGTNGLTQNGGSITPATNPLYATPGQNYSQYEAAQGYGGVGATNPSVTYPGIVSTLAQTASQPSQNFNQNINTSEQAQSGLLNSIPSQNANVQSATTNLQDLQNNYATQTGLIGNSPIGLSEQGGEQGLLNTQYASKLGAAETALSNALTGNAQQQAAYNQAGTLANSAAGAATTQQGTQQSGLGAAGGLSAPQSASPYGTYNPLSPTQYTGYGGGSSGAGAAGAGVVQGQVQAGQQYAQNSAILGKVNAQLPALQSAISAAGFNPSSVTGINQIMQWGKGNLSDSSIPEIQGSLNDIVASLSQVLGVPSSSTSDFRTQFANQIVNSLQSGQSIQQAIEFAVQQAEAGNQGYLNGATNANGTQQSNNSAPSGYSGWGATQ